MSEQHNANKSNNLHGRLLASVSAIALLSFASGSALADDDTDRPNVWIELGGQLEQMQTGQQPLTPAFALKPQPKFETVTPIKAEAPPRFAIGGEGKLTFEPTDSDWVFSAAIRYGRSNGDKNVHNQTVYPSLHFSSGFSEPVYDDAYATTIAKHNESHMVLDFQVGRDVGLGFLGPDSVLSFGVRYAQLSSNTTVSMNERPHIDIRNSAIKYFHSYALSGHSERSFHAVGPSLSWDGSAPLIGNDNGAHFTFDWGANAAILFGRQKANVLHKTSGRYVEVKYGHQQQTPYHITGGHAGAHSVTVPNLGGFASVSLKFPNAKVSLGYRGDFFFGAMDGGIDKRESKTLGFYGPFATVSVGL